MTLKIHTEEDDQRQLKMTVEVEEARVEKRMRQAARKLARDIHVPGFRPGKAPYRVILRRVGRDPLRAEVVEEMVQPVLEEAVEQIEAELSAPPSLDDIEMEPLVFSFTVPLAPQVKLGDYRELRKEIEPVEIADEAIEEALEQIRVKNQKLEDVDRSSQVGDMVTISGSGEYVTLEADLDEEGEAPSEEAGDSQGEDDDKPEEMGAEEAGEDGDEGDEEAPDGADEADDFPPQGMIFQEESIDLLLDPEKLFAGTPFVDNLVGLNTGDDSSFSFIFPEDFEDESLVGKEGSFNITVLNIRSRELPELDDELAKLEGDYESLEELREATAKQLTDQAESQAKNDLIEGMIDDLLPEAEMVYPPAVVEREMDGMVENFRRQISGSGWEWSDYLKLQGDSEERIRENFRENAEISLTRRYALRQFILEEKLTVEEDDVEAAIAARVDDFGGNEDFKSSMADFYRTGSGLEMISSEILMDKVHERAKAILAGNAPELPEESSDQSDEEE